ncbi:uncharacterized protein PV06_02190 [Exophiala oligosperma]|uniref:Zn(2)-C6 fungal-type domain-containing protein n=1 Tax=Exophiala oligosperma TaxID=215243 RepID=A0A0D2C9Q6_9EURO|nr:uncharacterized protein PV06_02190 [Exophiala oligosperma]KIW46522.1 hypothetical protein PV06_02190 [Exophiala oligosperma]
MPRPRKSTTGPIKRRTRTGCQSCRIRKIKCGEEKPVCEQCKAKGLECVTATALKWESEYVSKGLSFGRAGVWSKDRGRTGQFSLSTTDLPNDLSIWLPVPRVFPYSFVNTTIDNIQELLDYDDYFELMLHDAQVANSVAETEHEESTSTPSLSPWLTTQELAQTNHSITPPLDLLPSVRSCGPTETNLLLSYYVHKVSPLSMASLTSDSPLVSLLVPFAISGSMLTMNSILALSACHRSRSDSSYKATALQLVHGVLQDLRARLRDSEPSQVAMSAETLVVMVLLCMFEIANESDKRWVIHLKGARDLVRLRRQITPQSVSTLEESQIIHFCERFFAFQDVIGRTACGEDPVFGSDFWEDNSECDQWLGCSPELVSVLSKITELGRQDHSVRNTPGYHATTAALETRLSNLKQQIWDIDDDVLPQAAELKRLAAELYLQCLLNGAGPSMPWVSAQVDKILSLVDVLLERQVVAGITWPLFVAAVQLELDRPFREPHYLSTAPTYARPFVLYALERLSDSMANVTRTRAVIEKIWQARDLQHISDYVRDTQKNDWEHFVAPLCGNMSLA